MSLASLPIQHPSWVYLTLAPVLTLGALSPTPSFAPLILLVALLRLHFTAIIPRRAWRSAISQVVLISLATALANAAPSLRALSTPAISLLVLAGLSALTTTIAAGTIALSYFVERDGSSKQGWTRATAFPAAWATIWALVERCSPIGQLATWGPVVNLGGYSWLRPVGGQVAVNWVVASWAVVLSDVAGAWMMGPVGDRNLVLEEDLISVAADDDDDDGTSTRPTATPVRPLIAPKTRRTLLLMGFLVLLAAPSYVLTELPPPVNAPDATAFGVACAMPYAQKNGRPKGPPSLADYVHESRTLQSQAKVILWPESAVHFTKAGEREEELAKIRPQINNGTYYGIGFEEVVYEDSPDGVWKSGMRRNGLVLLGWEGVVYEYYKRHLVPVAESFSMTPSNEKPSIFTMELHAPAGWTKPSWSPNEKHTRPVDLTASICLDFTTSASFADLPSRPALILAPARTWHTSIGLAMWEQAKARAEETGSMVLWCDGGEGGVSGVAGRGMRAFRQVGPGSWVQTISVPWPFDNRRTMFATFGTSSAVVLLWLVAGMGAFASSAVGHVTDGQRDAGKPPARLAAAVQHAVGFLRNIGQRERRDEERPLLG